jgi:xanthine dehydrogenase molybdopterin binding subunit/xanthine dehydrogenase small subunit
MTPELSMTINGKCCDVSHAPLHESLLDWLRRHGMTGTKCGCNEGDCGACTVLLTRPDAPPRAINGCLALVHSLAGEEIVTSEGLAKDELHPAQQSMISCAGSQCGYCTPGIICSLVEASARGVTADPDAVADQLSGNLCRCTGYRPIREAAAKIPATPFFRSDASTGHAVDSSDYLRPGSVHEALAWKESHPEAMFIAGATELAVLINKRHLRPDKLISLEHVDELRSISKLDDAWLVGAAVPLTDLEDALAGEFPSLSQMLRLFASRQIRHRATLGGNLITASPIGDSAPVLLSLDASVILESLAGRREVPLVDFFTGYRQTLIGMNELMVAVRIPRHPAGRVDFQKVSKRREMDISTVSAAIRIVTNDVGIILAARMAFGGVAAYPKRAIKTEQALVGMSLEEASSEKILSLLVSEFTPMTDLRGTAEYRKLLICDLFLRYLSHSSSPAIPSPSFADAEEFGHQKSLRHESARGHVTGAAMYSHDLALRRGALSVWPIRSSIACGGLLGIDASEALKLSGVHAILTAADVTGANNTGPARHDEPLFAEDQVFFHGQLIAAVVADSPELARLAAEKVSIQYEEKAPLLGIENAIAAASYHTDPHYLIRGDVESALIAAPHRIEGTFHIGGQEHFYLETNASLAEPDGDGGVHVHASTQHPSETQTIVAEVLGWSRNRVVVECPRMGGGFGGKESQANPWAALCALASVKLGKPVGIQLDRDHDIESTGKRHPFFARYKVGYDDTGKLLAADVELYSDGGWALDLSLPVNDRALFHLDNSYYIPHVRFRGQVCKTNVTSHTAYRGFGGPQGMLVIEEIIARISEESGIPAEKIRENNFYHGDGETCTTHYGAKIEDNRIRKIWDQLLDSSEFIKRRSEIHEWNAAHPFRKRGIALTPVKFGISFTLKHYNQAGALVLVYQDGTVQVNHGGTEMGQGLHTKILGVAMRELGIPADQIRLMHTRTDKVPNTSATAASSGSDLNGMAVADACAQLRARLLPLAAIKLGVEPGEITFRDGALHASNGTSISFSEICAFAYTQRVQLSAAGFYATPDLEWDWNVGKGKPFHYYAFGAAVTEVEIDGYTGMSHIRRTDILHDVGDSLNPLIDRGQIEGAYVQGAGWLTSEELKWDAKGKLLTHSASTYAIPAISDAPLDFRVSLLADAAQPNTIHGSKAVGEPPFMLAISVREALRDAIHHFGVAHTHLPSPLTGETIKLAIGPMPC